ncbi:hypothetical protein C1645_793218 [Glomus cerebriforme]|uniref:Uncharacterized protein n=1 Tax=Glomus cerebriforme TaxID=658196 RepID=A0A397S118_9GLOM|nr:hypothetical protein C1645_793218 [Glomus cerebriforme]
MGENSAKTLFLLIFAIILCSYPLYTTAAIRTFTYQEQIDYGPQVFARVWDTKAYDDGTMVMRIARKNPSTSTPTSPCFYEMLSLRFIYPNGTVVEKDIKLDIQSFNYCVIANEALTEEFLKYFLIRNNQILVTYHNATDLNDVNSYVQWGMIIDFDGNVLDRTPFGFAFVDKTVQPSRVIPKAQIQANINSDKGFLRINLIRDTTDLEWQQYKIEPEGTFTKLTSGTIPFANYGMVSSYLMATVDEGYAIAFANTTTSTYNASNPLLPQGQLFILPLEFNTTAGVPLLLYQTPIPGLTFTSLFCDIAFAGIGQVCTLTALQKDPTGVTPDRNFYVKVNFLSSGSVSSFQVLNRLLPVANANFIWVVKSLPYGGYLLTNTVTDVATATITISGYLFDENSENPIQWEFPEPELTDVKGVFQVLKNNTLLVAQPDKTNSWQFQAIDLPRFVGDKDRGYSNFNVESTSPGIQSTISPDISQISISFFNPVEQSLGQLSIYQTDGSLRQTIPSSLCNIDDTGKIVSADILSSTFSILKGSYYVKMDNNFVRDKAFKEPLLGIRENVWTFTSEGKKDAFSPKTNGLLRLTVSGSQYFDSLPQSQRGDFFNKLLDELSVAVPVSRPRLSSNERTQVDNTLNEKSYLVNIEIKETRDENEHSAVSVVKIIDTMIKNKEQTPIGQGQIANYLDETYGLHPSPDLWESYKFRLLGLFLIVGLLIVLFLFAQRRDSNGNNIAILQLGLIIFDLVMDILFVSNNGKDVPELYIPSVVFVTMPISINTMFAFYIITKENTRHKFFQWFTAHGKVASVFTVLAGADIEALNILHSNLAGFPFFRAPFSDEAKSKIFWGACLNIFTEDIPQVVIQIVYRNRTVSYDNLIPLLTLISSAVNLTINIIGRLYQATNRLRHSKSTNYDNTNDSDDFGGLATVVPTPSDTSNNKKDLEGRLEEGDTSREIPKESLPQNYLGDVLNLNNSDEKLGLGNVLNKSFNASNSNVGNDSNKNQSKGMTFLKRMVSKKE